MRKILRLIPLCTICALAACGTGDGGSAKPVAAPATSIVTALPKPTGPAVLEVTGAKGEVVNADYASLDRLATKTYDIFEPFEKKQLAFTGVELWSVLQGAGVPATAKSVHLVALDDYSVDLSVADLKAGGVILATRVNGDAIPLEQGGPIRIVFGDGVEAGSNPDQWIWSVAKITVR